MSRRHRVQPAGTPDAVVAWKLKRFGSMRVASSRLRAIRPCELLREQGFPCELFDPRREERYEVVVFQKSFGSEDVELAARLQARGTRVVFDLDANHFYTKDDDESRHRLERLRAQVERADLVTFPSTPIGALVPHDRTALVPDLVEPLPHPARRRLSRLLRVVWFGNAGSLDPPWGMVDLHRISPAIAALHRDVPLRLTVISDRWRIFRKYFAGAPFPCRFRRWSLRSFGRHLHDQDVCVLPVQSNPVTECKSSNRLVLPLMMGVPVVCDPIPSYREFEGMVLFADWRNNLQRYARDQTLRREHLSRAASYLAQHYSPQRVAARWREVLEPLLAGP